MLVTLLTGPRSWIARRLRRLADALHGLAFDIDPYAIRPGTIASGRLYTGKITAQLTMPSGIVDAESCVWCTGPKAWCAGPEGCPDDESRPAR